MTAPELLRSTAKEYELNVIAARDRGEHVAATAFTTIAIALYEVASCLEASSEAGEEIAA